MGEQNSKNWQFNRKVKISVIIQLALLASLIVGSWFNLQGQLDLLQHDVQLLLQNHEGIYSKLENLQASSISYEYRLQSIEGQIKGGKVQ